MAQASGDPASSALAWSATQPESKVVTSTSKSLTWAVLGRHGGFTRPCYDPPMVTPVATVYGVPLEPGERVVYYHRSDPGWQKPFLIVLGVLTLIAIIGVVFLLIGIMASTTVYVVTTRRFIVIDGSTVSAIRHGEVKRITKKMAGSIVKWVDLT